jgi:acetyl esterase/lipase
MATQTRRGFVKNAAMTPLLLGAAMAADAGHIAAAAINDPYSYVDPELAAALKKSGRNSEVPSAQNLAAWRAADKNSSVLDAPELQPRKSTIPGPAGQGDVGVLIFDPKPDQKNRPAVIFIHGGGFIVGRADTSLHLAQLAAQATGAFTVSVDYALAPEARFPVALEQNYAVLAWLHRNAARLGIDPTRIAVMGDSAGGGHAAMLTIAVRDRREFALAYQCLIYPELDDRTGSTRAMPPTMGHFLWTPAANRFAWASLLGMPAGSASPPPGSVPARVKDLSGLPPAFIGVGSIDLFCDEDIEYARRLAMAGISTELFLVPGAYHGFDIVAPDAKLTLQFYNVWQNALRRGLGLG